MALEPPFNTTPAQVVTVATPGVSLVLPAFNEQEVIQQAIAEADDALRDLVDDYEILIVDDGSSDQTRSLAEAEARHRSHVRVLAHETNRGYGAALRTGFQAATKQWIGFTDSDCQFDLRQLERLLLLLKDNDIACGYRIDRQDSWLRILYSRVYNVLVGLMLGTGVRDCDCALKMFRRETLQAVMHESNGFLVNAEMLTKARLLDKKVIEVGVSHRPRPRGESTVSVMHTIPVFQSLLRFWWKTILFPGKSADTDPQGQTAANWSTGRVALAAGVLSLLAMWIMFWNLNYPLVEPDESRYAQIALEMVNSGDYLVPRLQGEPYLDKPPLLYWATAASFNLFGQSELAAHPFRLRGDVDGAGVILFGSAVDRRPGCLAWFAAAIPLSGLRLVGAVLDHGRTVDSVHNNLLAGGVVGHSWTASETRVVDPRRRLMRVGSDDERPSGGGPDLPSPAGHPLAGPTQGSPKTEGLAVVCHARGLHCTAMVHPD